MKYFKIFQTNFGLVSPCLEFYEAHHRKYFFFHQIVHWVVIKTSVGKTEENSNGNKNNNSEHTCYHFYLKDKEEQRHAEINRDLPSTGSLSTCPQSWTNWRQETRTQAAGTQGLEHRLLPHRGCIIRKLDQNRGRAQTQHPLTTRRSPKHYLDC